MSDGPAEDPQPLRKRPAVHSSLSLLACHKACLVQYFEVLADRRLRSAERINKIVLDEPLAGREFACRIDAGMVGIDVGIPVPSSVFPFRGHKKSFFGDLHVMGRDGIMFYTETKAVTSFWFDEEAMKGEKVGTWEGTITRS